MLSNTISNVELEGRSFTFACLSDFCAHLWPPGRSQHDLFKVYTQNTHTCAHARAQIKSLHCLLSVLLLLLYNLCLSSLCTLWLLCPFCWLTAACEPNVFSFLAACHSICMLNASSQVPVPVLFAQQLVAKLVKICHLYMTTI